MSYGPDEMRATLRDVFAPWVQALGIEPVSQDAEGAVFRLPASGAVARGGMDGPPVMCGQAIAAAADTCSALTLWGLAGRFRNCTTVDLTVHFLRPVAAETAELRVTALSNGRRLATTRVELRPVASDGSLGKLAAAATCAFAYLED